MKALLVLGIWRRSEAGKPDAQGGVWEWDPPDSTHMVELR